MTHIAVFSKRVCHQMMYDNWQTATYMKYHSGGNTDSLAENGTKGLLMLFKAELAPLKYQGVFALWMPSL